MIKKPVFSIEKNKKEEKDCIGCNSKTKNLMVCNFNDTLAKVPSCLNKSCISLAKKKSLNICDPLKVVRKYIGKTACF